MKWLVQWTLTVTVPTPCPEYRPDPYTGEYPLMSCAVYHCETTTRQMSRCFDTEEEAEAFIAAGKGRGLSFFVTATGSDA